MVSSTKIQHDYFNSYKYREPVSNDYEVFVNGEKVPVYTCRISKYPFNSAWPGHQRPVGQSEIASFVNIVSDEKVDIKVVVKKKYKNLSIRPYSKKIEFEENNGIVSFSLSDEGQFVLSADDFHNCLYIFNTKPMECNKEDVTYYFGPGVHMPGRIQLKDNESIYVDKDALVFGCVYAENAKNIRVFGNGIFDDTAEERICVHCYEAFTNGNLKFYDCENVKVEGVLFRNSATWSIGIFHCFDVTIDNIKVFGQWRYNSDGVDFVNCKRAVLKNSFIHSFDDSVTVKGIDRYIDTDNEDILTENCVLWCDWGRACELGFETACREIKNVVFRNCDIIRAGSIALDIQNGDCAEISNVVFENINVEYNSFDHFPLYQKNEECVYDAQDKSFVPNLVTIVNYRFRNDFYCNDIWGISKEHAPLDLSGIKEASAHDIVIRNINVYYDEKIEKIDGKYNVPMVMTSVLDGVEFYNINISNISINGEALKKDDAILRTSGDVKFLFDGE